MSVSGTHLRYSYSAQFWLLLFSDQRSAAPTWSRVPLFSQTAKQEHVYRMRLCNFASFISYLRSPLVDNIESQKIAHAEPALARKN